MSSIIYSLLFGQSLHELALLLEEALQLRLPDLLALMLDSLSDYFAHLIRIWFWRLI
jgi:hypothetical protein